MCNKHIYIHSFIGPIQIWTDGPLLPSKEGPSGPGTGPTPSAGLPSLISIFVDEKFKIGMYMYIYVINPYVYVHIFMYVCICIYTY
jgi:hypothetical protein